MLEELVKKYQETHDKKILEEIIELSRDVITYYHKVFKSNLSQDEIYDYIIEGLIKAANSYKVQSESFLSYADKNIKRVILRKINRDNRNGGNLFSDFLVIKRIIEERFKVKLEDDFSIFDDIIEEMLIRGLITKDNYQESRKTILVVLEDYWKSLRMNIETFDYFDIPFDLPIDNNNFKELLLTMLGERKFQMFAYQYGLFGLSKLSQTKIGEKFNTTKRIVGRNNRDSLLKIKTYFENIDNKHTRGDI